jgi:hypothetical protein
LGINTVSIKTVNRYEVGLQIGLASIGSDLLRYAGAHPIDHWATVAGYCAIWEAAG